MTAIRVLKKWLPETALCVYGSGHSREVWGLNPQSGTWHRIEFCRKTKLVLWVTRVSRNALTGKLSLATSVYPRCKEAFPSGFGFGGTYVTPFPL